MAGENGVLEGDRRECAPELRDPYHRDHLAKHVRTLSDRTSQLRSQGRSSRFFRRQVARLVARRILPNSTVVDIGCGEGLLIEELGGRGVIGIDLDARNALEASARSPEAALLVAPIEEADLQEMGVPDYLVLSLVLDEVYDVQVVLDRVAEAMRAQSRLICVTYNRAWFPFLRLAEVLGLKASSINDNYIPWHELENMLHLAGLRVTQRADAILVPIDIPVLSDLINRWMAPLPLLRNLALVRITIARRPTNRVPIESVSIVIPARNEEGHLEEILSRLPRLAHRQEIIFVEGGSTDGTWDKIQQLAERPGHPDWLVVRAARQTGVGKADAVRVGFSMATGDVLLILDADISVPPEELPKFVSALERDQCEFANGSRLVYPMESEAMRWLNLVGNRLFSLAFSYLFGQRVSDTLCGTKALTRHQYRRLEASRTRYQDEDPFGDFDLLFGASRAGLEIADVPIHYKERTYGSTNIARFRHGWMLLKMCGVAARNLKFA